MSAESPPRPVLLAWVTEGRHALVVGGGDVSTRRTAAMIAGKARVTLVSPDVTDELAARTDIEWTQRRYETGDLDGADLVLVAIDDRETSARIAAEARARRIPVHVADDPPLCDFYFAASHVDGPIQIAISTSGAGPALAGRLRNHIVQALPPEAAAAIDRFGRLRRAVRDRLPEEIHLKRRMRWLTRFARRTTWADLAEMDDTAIIRLADRAASDDPDAA